MSLLIHEDIITKLDIFTKIGKVPDYSESFEHCGREGNNIKKNLC